MIEVAQVSKSYGKIQALTNIEFTIDKGSCFGLVGPNGAGKSTLMKILAGILRHFEGDVVVDRFSVAKEKQAVKQLIGYIPQELCLEETLTARDNLLLFGRLYGLSGKNLNNRIDNVLEKIGLTERSKDTVLDFSGGMKRRLNIGCALLHDPAIVIMDEPTVGIDPQSRNSIFSIIEQLKADGSTIIYSSHYMEEVEQLCDRIGLIDKGVLLENGTMNRLMEKYGTPSLYVSGDTIEAEHLHPYQIAPKGEGYLVSDAEPLATLEKLLVRFRELGLQPRRLELYYPKLEDIFFQLTGTKLRDN
ncbi:ATP-binding cassette domain-containing protein [Sediminibacillus dalangtanensis]|uniref:ATP-binding cassette domain-containing protein n=1 Tax=Sediminibacillus dalangtanensis TaxID=2729421 RepID=A0ABX7VTG8_9BACI|nr:ABC transporter ATP-binding protein [Sediminibacillus dalangtanensis]QTM98885.1 ATP-binding cassette domain-containing protein [Sediminibacillus dalangtanensis]